MTMGWFCKQCETVNSDDVLECEVCDAISPHLSRFDYEEIDSTKPTTLKWKAEACDSVILIHKGIKTDVTDMQTARIIANRDTEVSFLMSSDIADRVYCYAIRVHKPPLTRIRLWSEHDMVVVLALCDNYDFKRCFSNADCDDNISSLFDKSIHLLKRGLIFPYVIETLESEFVGIVSCQITIEDAQVAGLVSCSIMPIYRNYGLGTDALIHMRNETKKAGVEVLTLEIIAKNLPAIRVAEKCGFKCKDAKIISLGIEECNII